jgi:hypothetical protein
VKIRLLRLSCRDASVLLSQAQDRELGLYERVKLRLHLAVCDGCSNFLRQLAFMRTALRRYRDNDGA